MNCPKCNAKARICTQTRGATTLLGAGAGGYVAATAGAVAGNTVGRLLDENVFRIWRCDSCGYEWRAA